jgi:hypothetical protein
MNDESKRLGTEAVVAKLKIVRYPGICLERLKEERKTSVGIAGLCAEI